MFIDPSKTPLIDRNDPRWLGAWWFGWILLGTAMLMFSGLIALFPKKLPKAKAMLYDSHHPRILLAEESKNLNGDLEIDTRSPPKDDPPKLKGKIWLKYFYLQFFPKILLLLTRIICL